MKNRHQIIHECVRLLTKMLPDEEARLQLVLDQNLAKYLLLSLPYLSYFLVGKILDILIEVSNDDYERLQHIHQSIEEIMSYPSRSFIALEHQAA